MLKYFLIFFFSYCCSSGYAQSDRYGFQDFYIGFSPLYTRANVWKSNFPKDSIYKGNHFSESVRNEWGYSIGVRAEYHISKRLGFATGFTFSNVKYSKNIKGFEFVSDRFPLDNQTISYLNTLLSLRYVDIPLDLKLYLDKKRTFYLGGGLAMNVLVNEKFTDRIIYGKGGIDKVRSQTEQTVSIGNYTLTANCGKKIKLGEAYDVLIQPTIQFKLKPDIFDTFSTHANQLTAGLGIFVNVHTIDWRKAIRKKT